MRSFLAAIFLGILWIAFAPRIRAHIVSFDVGDDLYWRSTNKVLGSVVEVEADHEFPEGAQMPAYRVQPASDSRTSRTRACTSSPHGRRSHTL